jgi:HlyD family secretion protein
MIGKSGAVNVYSPTNGIVDEVFIKNEDVVKKAQELFTVKSTATQQEQQRAYADYMTAKSTLETATATNHSLQAAMFEAWDEFRELATNDTYENADGTPKHTERALPEFHIAEKNWLAAEQKFKTQQSVIAQAQAQLSSATLLYEATKNATVKATADGVVSNLSVVPGSIVSINTALAPTTPVLSIGNFAIHEVIVSLGENDIPKVEPGQRAVIEVDAIDGKTFSGIVRRVDKIGTEVRGVIRYNLYVELLEDDPDFRPGMSVDVDITARELANVLIVPNTAVKPYQGGRAVRVPSRQKGKFDYIPVEIGTRGNKYTEIIKGLSDGQTIITTLTSEEAKKKGFLGL